MSVSTTLVNDVDKFAFGIQEPTLEEQEVQFRIKLGQYLVTQIHIDALVLRYVYEYSYKDISIELFMPSPSTAYYVIKKAQDLLKERGFRG